MKSIVWKLALGVALLSAAPTSPIFAEDGAKALPVLLIKGEIVSLDTNDPTAALLKVKDRYGFETPIYVTPEAKVTKGDAQSSVTNLATGEMVDVEYNFDINTAKRHAVSIKVALAAATTPPEPAAAAVAPPAVPVTPPPAPPEPEATAQPDIAAPVATPAVEPETAPTPQ